MSVIIEGKRVRKKLYLNNLPPKEALKKAKRMNLVGVKPKATSTQPVSPIEPKKKKVGNWQKRREIQALTNHVPTGLSGRAIPKKKIVKKKKVKNKQKKKIRNESPELPEKHKPDYYWNGGVIYTPM